jgi:hypothetical protein
VKPDTPRAQSWKTFLDNHIPDLAAIDFFTVPTVTFRVLASSSCVSSGEPSSTSM